MSKVAIITGGASGMGLAVAKALSERGGWTLHILDMNAHSGEEVARTLPNTTYHKVDVTSYSQLGPTFNAAFTASGNRLDFVYANAGIIERKDFYARHAESIEPPPEPDLLSIDINLKGVVLTSYLALHYFRQSPHKGQGASLVMTGSCSSFYPSDYSPIYTSAKHGVAGFVRSIAAAYHLDGIRANAVCPGLVRTNIVSEDGWANFPKDIFTPVEMVAKVVLLLIDGNELTDSDGNTIPAEKTYGQTVEVMKTNYYIRTIPEFCDAQMAELMRATSVENQKGGVIKG
ncbi:MAG: hypothetical protein M1820_009624 [Bogoriella megaspora]|nr:MAG: hypothetical protein M1820_009624 [Bogoriella megaspora]